jgi:hypothetical protein
MKNFTDYVMESFDRSDVIFKDNELREDYFRVASLMSLVEGLETAVKKGSGIAKKELPIYREMLKIMKRSDLGKVM